MARFDITLLGDDIVAARLRALPEKLERKVLRQAMRKAGRPILADAKANAPVKTGKMRASLKLRALKRKRGRVGVRIETGTRAELGIPAEERWYYPAIVELGDGTARHLPHSFMRSALAKNRENSVRILRDDISRGIEREATTPV